MKERMRWFWLFWLSCLGVLILSGCAHTQQAKRQEAFRRWIEDNGKIKILSTTAMINDLVQHVGGPQVDTLTLIEGELDPHSYQLVKGDDEKLRFAELIFYSGLGLEHGPSLQHHLLGNPKAIALGDLIEQKDPSLIVYVEDQKDPHIWMDISIWSQAVPFIVEALSQKDPAHAALFKERGDQLQKEMAEAHQEAIRLMHQVPEAKRYLVTSHDAFNYFARAYLSESHEWATGEWSKRFAAPEGLAPESQLSVTHIKAIIDYLKQHHVSLVFPETNVSRDSIKKIIQAGQEQGLDVKIACCPLYGDAMGKPGSEGDSYLKMIIYNAKTLSTHMNGVDSKDH